MAALGGLLSYARKEEAAAQKLELEKRLFPLWLVNYAVSKIKPGLEVMEYDEFIKPVFSDSDAPQPKAKKERTAEDIMAEFMPFVEADKKRGG